MPRPTKPRLVEFIPDVLYFKPAGVRMRELEEVYLGVDEIEALRLKDVVGLEQEDCAQRMNLAQSTFQRILTAARTKVSTALTQGKALRIEGGNYVLSPLILRCRRCGQEWTNRDRESDEQCPSCGSDDNDVLRRPVEDPSTPPGAGQGSTAAPMTRADGPAPRMGRNRYGGGGGGGGRMGRGRGGRRP